MGNATLILADCRDWLESLPKCFRVDAVITDPPYGVEFSGKAAHSRGKKRTKANEGYLSTDDTPEYIETVVVPTFTRILARAKRAAVTPGTKNMWLYPRPADVGTFFSASGTGLATWGFCCSQPILYYGKCPYLERGMGGRPNSMGQSYPNDANQSGHPCAKPLPQMRWLVNRVTMMEETVLDPFMGSGTTGVACVDMNRKFLGVEIEPKYFELACERIARAQDQQRLFA